MRNMVECRGIVLGYGSGFTLQVDELIIPTNAFIHFAGANGSGKTSLLKSISGMLRLKEGCVRINGVDIVKTENWKTNSGIYLGEQYLPGFLTAREYLTLVCAFKNKSMDLIDEAVRQNQLGAKELMGEKKFIRQFSQGTKVRLALLGAFIGHPSLLILDEPFAHLDQDAQLALRRILFDFNQRGATVLCACHETHALQGLITETIVLDKGRVRGD